jgi:hypothetical protein
MAARCLGYDEDREPAAINGVRELIEDRAPQRELGWEYQARIRLINAYRAQQIATNELGIWLGMQDEELELPMRCIRDCAHCAGRYPATRPSGPPGANCSAIRRSYEACGRKPA